MSRKYKILFVIYFVIVGIVIFTSNDLSGYANKLEYVKCGTATGIPKPVPQLTTIAYTLLVAGTPIILIAFSIITLVKATLGGNADEITKARSKLFKKFIIAAVIFLSSSIVQFVLLKVTSNNNDSESVTACLKCFLYYSDGSCPASDTGNDIEKGTHNRVHSNVAIPTTSNRKSNSNTNSNASNSSTSASMTQVVAVRKMMYAAETGGMEFGKQNYSNFGKCYNLTSTENSITIGAGGWFATDAKTLLTDIRNKYPQTFKQYDTAGIGDDLDNKNWANYCIDENSVKAKAIVAIISSPDGIKAQDDLMDGQVIEYFNLAKSKGISDSKAQAMYAEMHHVGGESGADRILKHAKTPYTVDTLFVAATSKWPDDAGLKNPINGTMYTNRHTRFKNWVNEYM